MKTECQPDLIKLEGRTYPCTVSLVMDLMGGKWKAVILYHLKNNSKRYNELRKEMPTVTERTLSLQLKQLEEDGLVFRKVEGKKPPIKVTYGLTEFGKSFSTVLDSITELGNSIAAEKGEFIKN
ncbi:winged helix-turn-helix transcriptional regulator [Flavobacterium sp. N2038]|uniref:winged helix-turn-helix transcriptional regulator n=1 Tax=Flavobacterium sp. N2038 TaxID=2986829 RepID=UPI002224EE6E|nr:helix-turn-helix domain-containing protein [Flavobacterium sp. N2038]